MRSTPFVIADILNWAGAWHAAHGRCPTADDGAVPDVPGQSWAKVDDALRHGTRRLPRGGSLASS